MLTIVRLCIAIYAGSYDTVPVWDACFDLPAPVEYDVGMCPGEVTTPAPTSTTATCEITIED